MKSNPPIAIVERFFSGTGSTYDFIVNFWTFGCDLWWKKRIMDKIPPGPKRIIDQACGTGILTIKIARRFPLCSVTGVELREEYLSLALQKARAVKQDNIRFILGRAEDVILEDGFDCITSSYLAKYAEMGVLIHNARRMLRKGGLLIMHDFTYPPGRGFARLWEFYFKIMQALGSRKYPQWTTVFYELPLFLRETTWVVDLVRSLREERFLDITIDFMTFGTSAVVSARRG
jgi:demethylmenaquinone methyltransferase/2-methoxy-6-polyprenyl-1,4-benzoquinol methylase